MIFSIKYLYWSGQPMRHWIVFIRIQRFHEEESNLILDGVEGMTMKWWATNVYNFIYFILLFLIKKTMSCMIQSINTQTDYYAVTFLNIDIGQPRLSWAVTQWAIPYLSLEYAQVTVCFCRCDTSICKMEKKKNLELSSAKLSKWVGR